MSAGHSHPHSHSHAHSHEVPDFELETREEGPSSHRLEVRVAQAAVDQAFDRVYRDLARTARVKGFRPGKVPRRVLEKLYGGALGEDIERMLVNETLGPALERAGLEPVTTPDIEAETPRSGAPFVYAARVEVRPAIELPELEGLPGTRPAVTVGPEDVERELEGLRQRHAVIVEEDEGVEAGDGHILTVDYVGRIDGEVFEGGTGRDVDLEIGSGRFVPGFEEQLRGARAEDDREVSVTFPDDYDPSVAGKDAVFQVHVAAVKRRDVPELDDDFARDLGEVDTIEALRDRIHADLREHAEHRADRALRQSLAAALVEGCSFQVPPAVIDHRLDQRLRMAAQDLLRSGMPEEALAPQLERWRSEWRPAAEQDVREQWALEAVADAKELAVEDAEVAERLEQFAASQGLPLSALREQVDAEALTESIRDELRREKALDFIVSTAKVEEETKA